MKEESLTTDFTDTTDGRRESLRLGLVRNGSDEKIETAEEEDEKEKDHLQWA
jgi:hypothetical protein